MPRLLSAAALLLAAASAAFAQTPQPLLVLVLTGQTDLPYHHWKLTTPFLREAMERSGRFEVRVVEDARGLGAGSLEGYDVLLLNYNGPRWSPVTERAIEEFVRGGKGIVTFHQSSYGAFFGMEYNKRWTAKDKGWEAFPALLGARWEIGKIGHAPRHVFDVKWTSAAAAHPIARGMEPAFQANDELYHKLDLLPNTKVLATAFDNPAIGGTGKEEPVLWVADYGKGRGFHSTLGHDLSAMYGTGFLTTFLRGVEWAASGAVTLPAKSVPRPTASKDAVRLLVVTGGHAYPSSFYTLFEGFPEIRWSHATSQKEAFNARLLEHFDVVLFHDMGETIGEAERTHLKAFVEAGRGIVSTHHAIVNYTSWPWWYQEVIGGKYFAKPVEGRARSEFKEGVDFVATPVKAAAKHPVLRGVGPLAVHDEVYRNMWHSPKIQVLMETGHPLNDRPVVYVGPHPSARAIYIQLGHGDETMRHPGYRQLVRNAVLWAARKL